MDNLSRYSENKNLGTNCIEIYKYIKFSHLENGTPILMSTKDIKTSNKETNKPWNTYVLTWAGPNLEVVTILDYIKSPIKQDYPPNLRVVVALLISPTAPANDTAKHYFLSSSMLLYSWQSGYVWCRSILPLDPFSCSFLLLVMLKQWWKCKIIFLSTISPIQKDPFDTLSWWILLSQSWAH